MTQAPALPSPRAATQRHDGWTPERRRIFLETLAECDGVVSLPMFGAKSSINVGNAAAAILYAILARSGVK